MTKTMLFTEREEEKERGGDRLLAVDGHRLNRGSGCPRASSQLTQRRANKQKSKKAKAKAKRINKN